MHKSFRNQLATLETCIERVFRLKNFDIVDVNTLNKTDKTYYDLSNQILEKLNSLLS